MDKPEFDRTDDLTPERTGLTTRANFVPAAWLESGAAVVTENGTLLSANESLAGWLKTTPMEIVGQNLRDLLGRRHAEWDPGLTTLLADPSTYQRSELFRANDREGERLGVELSRHKEVRFIRIESLPPRGVCEARRKGEASVGFLPGTDVLRLDNPEQHEVLQRLSIASWRASLGTLAMVLIHDFCNLATGLVGLSQMVETSKEKDNALGSSLTSIRNAALAQSQLAHRLQRLYRGTPGERSFVDLNASVSDVVDLLQKVLPRRVRLTADLVEGQLPLYVDALELERSIIVLALNAADAMPSGGEAVFSTRRFEKPPGTSNVRGIMPPPPLCSLSVADTGSGIAPQILEHLAEPFFTDKPPGRGVGLGLYRTRLFAEAHGAALSVEPQPGSGTVFRLWFPLADLTAAGQM